MNFGLLNPMEFRWEIWFIISKFVILSFAISRVYCVCVCIYMLDLHCFCFMPPLQDRNARVNWELSVCNLDSHTQDQIIEVVQLFQHHVDPAIGVYIIDRFTYYALEFLERVTPDSKKTLAQFVCIVSKM